jgi:hypothetical protein
MLIIGAAMTGSGLLLLASDWVGILPPLLLSAAGAALPVLDAWRREQR